MFPEVQTPELCLDAVQQNGFDLLYIKPEFQTLDIIEKALDQNIHSFAFIKNPELFPEICIRAVEKWDGALGFIPSDMPEYDEIAITACFAFPKAIIYVKDPILRDQILKDIE